MRGMVMLAAVLLIAGCSPGTVTGSAVRSTSGAGGNNAENVLFDPCDMPADSLRAADVEPTIVTSEFLGFEPEDWKLCTWKGPRYYVTILSTVHTFDEIKANPQSDDFEKAFVGSRDAVTYRSLAVSDTNRCDVAFAWSKGTVVVRVDGQVDKPDLGDACAVVTEVANTFDSVLPR